jgi:hypothetical protein
MDSFCVAARPTESDVGSDERILINTRHDYQSASSSEYGSPLKEHGQCPDAPFGRIHAARPFLLWL